MWPENIGRIVRRLHESGFKTYIVGGAVRDMVLKKAPGDFDILTQASLPEIQSVFSDREIRVVGKTFPICLVNGVEVSSGRAGLGHFPESDLARRDLTVNAMAMDPFFQTLLDPFNGRQDLEDKVIRFTGDPMERILEDPVRMVRACRFRALLSGTLHPSAVSAIQAFGERLSDPTAKERVGLEIMKAMTLEKPSLFFRSLRDTGLLARIFPSLDRCHDLDGGPHHAETVFEHCLLVGDALFARMPLLRLAGFLHDVGKFDAAVVEDGVLSFAGHENHIEAVLDDLTGLRFSVRDRTRVTSLIRTHMRPLTETSTPRAVRRLLAMLDSHAVPYRDFMRMRIADKKGNLAKRPYTLGEIRVRLKKVTDAIHSTHAFNINNLEISGRDIVKLLGIKPSPEVGRIKQALFEAVLDNPELNHLDELKQLCRSFQTKE